MNRQEMNQNYNWPVFTTSLHTHVRSLHDAHIDAQVLCKKVKEMGGKGIAVTDHGVVSAIEDYKAAFAEEGLKLIPGCELYIDGGILGRLHLVVLAKNDNGWKGISKMVTEANKTLSGDYPVLSEEKLFSIANEYKGDIIATSACMQGVINAIYLKNNAVEKKVSSVREKQLKYISPDSEEIKEAIKKILEQQEALERAINNRDKAKATAEQKFAKREKAVEKLLKSNAPEAEEILKELNADKKAAKKAANILPGLKDVVERAKKALSKAKKDLTTLNESAEKWEKYEIQINKLKQNIVEESKIQKEAETAAIHYQEAFGKECFYIELQNHGIPAEAECFPKIAELAKELNIPVVATNDVHIVTNSDSDRLKRQILRSMRFGKTFEEENVGDKELFLKDNYELAESLLEILPISIVDKAIKNIDTIFNSCNVEFKTEKHYPKFYKNVNAEVLFDEEVEKGIKWRFPNGMDEEYKQRIMHEVSVIKSMGFTDYLLIVKDFLEYGRNLGFVPKEKLNEAPLDIEELKQFIKANGWKNPGMTIGPGRGSAAGSLVCFVLGITSIDPIKYGLLFERFLNPERVSMPDIDSDIAPSVRGKVIEYVQEKYGKNAVCGIMTVTIQQPKGAIRIAAKYYGFKEKGSAMTYLGDMIAKEIPGDVGVSFSTKVAKDGSVTSDGTGIPLKEYLLEKYKDNKDAVNVIKWAVIVEGSFTAYGAHAAGIVIADNDDISDYIPLRMNDSLGMLTTQCDMVQVEENGLLKFDLLGLKTLDVITDTIRLIEKNYGIIIDPYNISLDEADVYHEIFSAGKTHSVFQLESEGMKSMLKRFRPKCFEDLIILVSMYRPGPMQYIDGVIDVKNGKKPMTFLCPQLNPILSKTYGAIVYQEQVMEIFQKLAGYTLGGADTVRRYMSKKKTEKLVLEKESFIHGDKSRNIIGCVENKIAENASGMLFEQMVDFAKYAFNKSHAAIYALVAYMTAYLKLRYPAEYFTSAANWCDSKKLSGHMYEATSFGVSVKAPDINTSEKEFTVKDGIIHFGLSAVTGVKDHADEIIAERENGVYVSVKDFCIRAQQNSMVTEHLISAGAFDCFSKNRAAMIKMSEEVKDLLPDRNKKESFIRSAELVLPFIEKEQIETIIKKQEEAGFKVEINEPTTAEKLEKRIQTAKDAVSVINKNIEAIRLHDIKEDKTERMSLEKKFLGMYVTEHPMDFYPDAKDVSACKVCEINEGSDVAYGIISEYSIDWNSINFSISITSRCKE